MAHVVVALCDNLHQGIQPVPDFLGKGDDPDGILYWGAMFGVRYSLVKKGGWRKVAHDGPKPEGVLERLILRRTTVRADGATAQAFIVADAWEGRRIQAATRAFLTMAGGGAKETIQARGEDDGISLAAGGSAHLVAYVGHNGLMDFSMPAGLKPEPPNPAKSAILLACKSKSYFEDFLNRSGAHPLLLTNGLMAPEAYTLDSALKSWLAGEDAAQTHEAAAQAYHRHQECGIRGARWLFHHAL